MMADENPFAHVLRSTVFWMMIFTALLFFGLAHIRPLLRALGWLFALLGGPGLEGSTL